MAEQEPLRLSVRCANPDCNNKIAKVYGVGFVCAVLCSKCGHVTEIMGAVGGVTVADAGPAKQWKS